MNPLIQFKKATPLFLVALVCFGLLPITQAVSPPPDGGYPHQNTAEGDSALLSLTTGARNTAIGFAALNLVTTGGNNTAIVFFALSDNTIGRDNIALGYTAGVFTTGDDNIDIGNEGVADESATIRIGTERGRGVRSFQSNTYIAGISGVTIAAGAPVIVDATGHLGSTTSSERFKDNIKPMDKASEALLALKPVTFHYKKEIDPTRTSQFGLVAEDVEKVNPDLVVRDKEGKPYTVRYEAVNAMLLNEFLKEHRKVEELTKDFQATVARLTARLDEQAAQIQKVSAQLEASKPAPQVVNNP
jgi:Chaperone of endosialidase